MDFSTLLKAADAFLLPPKNASATYGQVQKWTNTLEKQSKQGLQETSAHPRVHSLFRNSQELEGTQMSREINR